MKLSKLIALEGREDREISLITDNSKKIQKDCIFVCVKGTTFDGHSCAAQALEQGAALVVTERDLGLGNQQLICENSRVVYGELCSAWFDHPERKMRFVGVTGTNGKTTTSNVIKHILTQAGHKVGLIGTIQNEIGDKVYATANTTPLTYDLFELYHNMAEENCDIVVMEVSSFGLVQHRIGTTHFEAAVFTNLTPEHLDYHKDMEEYYLAKRMLFDRTDYALINGDDAYGERLFQELSIPKNSYGMKKSNEVYAEIVEMKPTSAQFYLCKEEKATSVSMLMTGKFNIANMMAAYVICEKMGVDQETILKAISEYKGVRGRCETIPTNREFHVVCDYAHTPDALEKILLNLKAVKESEGRLICLFGCGGNRDRSKRSAMGKIASEFSDFCIITSDNPRDEKPEDIIAEIVSGIENKNHYYVETDRIEAISYALHHAQKDDIILLAGKGHEDYQILANKVKIHLDEREVVADILKNMEG